MEAMDIDTPTSSKAATAAAQNAANVMAAPATVSSVTVSLHPLVIMNISEHWTRTRAQNGEPRAVYGALIGKQKGRNIEVMNSFELKIDMIDDQVIVNVEYYRTKESQYKQVFSELDFIGWYTTGSQPTVSDIDVQKQICNFNESPILLQLNPLSLTGNELPVQLFESVIDIVSGEATMLFVPLKYTLAAEEAERIGLDHVARLATNDTGEHSVLAEHMVVQDSAIKMLNSRIKILLKYIKEVETGKLEPNQEILREIYALSYRLPVMHGPGFHQEFYKQCNDVALISYLSVLTQGCNDINNFVNKFNVLHDRHSPSRRMRGAYY